MERQTKAHDITKAVQDMMLHILEDTRNVRTKILDTVDVTNNHRKAVVEVKALPVPQQFELRKI